MVSILGGMDFDDLTAQLTYNADSGSALCFNISLVSDDGIEPVENFTVTAYSNDTLVSSSINMQVAAVNIVDSDGELASVML